MPRFKFRTARKKKRFNFIEDSTELLDSEILKNSHIEIFSNKKIILEGCINILEYEDDFLKLKLKKGSLLIMGSGFSISVFENENIIINGNISSIEFCI